MKIAVFSRCAYRLFPGLLLATLLVSPASAQLFRGSQSQQTQARPASRPVAQYEPIVPGTGVLMEEVCDDFEDEAWEYIANGHKSSRNIDGRQRGPTGYSANRHWYESSKRGHPDIVRRVPTPEGGVEGSTGAMLLRSFNTGIPGRVTRRAHQDDFLMDIHRSHGITRVSECPNMLIRLYLPPVDEWEDRSGVHFGFRAGMRKSWASHVEPGADENPYAYYPGIWIEFLSETDEANEHDSAFFKIRARDRGGDFRALAIEQTGWWTLGMSVTPDGQMHYYMSPGVDPLTPEDHIHSGFPYGYRGVSFTTMFFDLVSMDDGQTWSTPWIIDDPEFYTIPRQQ